MSISACPRNSEMECCTELSDVLNWREICFEDFERNILMSSDGFQNLQNKFLFNLTRHSTLYDFPFQSYDQSKNVTVWHSDPSVLRGQVGLRDFF